MHATPHSELYHHPVRRRHRAAQLCVHATSKLAAAGGGSLQFEGRPWNDNTVDFIRLARAHSAFILLRTFADSVASMPSQVRHEKSGCEQTEISGPMGLRTKRKFNLHGPANIYKRRIHVHNA